MPDASTCQIRSGRRGRAMVTATMAHVEFWCELASTYTYLAAMRIEPLAQAAGVEVRWQPFSLGPIFAASGWTNSPFEIYPAKGRYMWRDVEREAAAYGIAWR